MLLYTCIENRITPRRNDIYHIQVLDLTTGQVTIHTEEAGRALILIGLTQTGMEAQLARALASMAPRPLAVPAPNKWQDKWPAN